MDGLALAVWVVALLFASFLYIRTNDAKLRNHPPEVAALTPERITPVAARAAAKELATNPVSLTDCLPRKTGRRYIVVGGSGFLGSWLVRHLLQRGEDPKNIRILDIRAPVNADLASVTFIPVDITSHTAVDAAFTTSWPVNDNGAELGTTVFHTAASIRYFERDISLLPLSTSVNVIGTRNVLAAARKAGVDVLIYTSSGSVALRRTRLLLSPWDSTQPYAVQAFSDGGPIPKTHNEFFSNYAVSKLTAESAVRAANGTDMKTGCIRPGNAVFGVGDSSIGAYLVRGANLNWAPYVAHSFIYVENCSLAHLCYEARLLETLAAGTNSDLGGDSFIVTDPGPAPTYADIETVLTTLTDNATTFASASPTLLVAIAYLLEVYYGFTIAPHPLFRWLASRLPRLGADVTQVQPAMFFMTLVHVLFDDERARKPKEKGGLEFKAPYTTLQGMCKTVAAHQAAAAI